MNKFDDREKSFEKKFAKDQELQFKVSAKRNKYLGEWASKILNYNSDQELYYIDITGDGYSEFTVQDGHALVYMACDDESGLNYPINVLNVLENLNIEPEYLREL